MINHTFLCTALFIFGLCTFTSESSANYRISQHADGEYETKILPLLKKYCMDCHSPGNMEDLEFLSVATETEVRKNRGLFAGVFETLHAKSMPPKNSDQPSASERALIANWIEKTLELKQKDTERIAQYVVEAFEDQNGNLWFGTMQKGVAKFDGKRLSYFSIQDGLPSNTVTSIAQDSKGTLWFGTHSGVAKYDGKKFNPVGASEGLPKMKDGSIESSAGVNTDRKGNVWVSIGRKVLRQNGNSFSEFKIPVPTSKSESYAILAGDVSFSLEDRSGNLWFSTDGHGIFKFDGSSFTQFTKSDGLCSDNITNIIEDRNGNIWATCIQSFQPKMTGDGGVCRLDGNTFTQFPDVKGLTNNDIYTIYSTRSGDIWIGATGVGAYLYDGKAFSLVDKTDRPRWTRHFGIQSILEDREGTIWFGFSGGLFRFNGTSFYNINQSGPWTGLYTAMADVASGKNTQAAILPTQTQNVLSALADNQIERSKEIANHLRQKNPLDRTVHEFTLNQVGYRLVFTKRSKAAINVFKLNSMLHPTIANTFDSLAEAYLRNGDYENAEVNYRKALTLDPESETARTTLKEIEARKKFNGILPVPAGWMEEVISLPPSFAPSMSLTGMEHLRLPPEFRDPESEWFCSYLFAMDLSEPQLVNSKFVSQQLLLYFRGLATGGRSKDGVEIDVRKFSIEETKATANARNEYEFVLNWQEPFVNATPQQLNIKVKFISEKSDHGVLFVCGSPSSFKSKTWKELLRIRSEFESSSISVDRNTKSKR